MPRGNIIEALKLLNKDLIAKQYTYKTDYENCENEKIFCNKTFGQESIFEQVRWSVDLKKRHQEMCLQFQDCQVIA